MTRTPVVPVMVSIPLHAYPRLAAQAELYGHEHVGELLLALALEDRLVPLRAETADLRTLVLAGLTDADIADATGLLVGEVATRRRRLKLPPNRRYRRRTA